MRDVVFHVLAERPGHLEAQAETLLLCAAELIRSVWLFGASLATACGAPPTLKPERAGVAESSARSGLRRQWATDS